MSAAKKKPSPAIVPPAITRLIALAWGPGRVLTLVAIMVLLLAVGWYFGWRLVQARVLGSDKYVITPANVDATIEITPLPSWINTDIKAEVFRDASFDGPLSIMDDDLTERIAAAFSLHPWVAKVHRVQKFHPARVQVELVYRRPVCMVEVSGGLLPVDVEGVLLPSADFSPVEASGYPRLTGIDTAPMGPVGTRWGDARVVGGAEITAAIGPLWHQWKLQRVVPSAPTSAVVASDFLYTLVTPSGTKILWGHSPSADAPGEPSPTEKVARLKKYVAEYGSLDPHDGPKEWDLRTLRLPPRP